MKGSRNRIYLRNVKRYGEGGKHMTKKRNIGMLILMGILMVLSLFTISASAEDGGTKFRPGMIIDGSKLTLGDSAFSPNYDIAPHGDYLAEGGCGITRVEKDIASVGGYTNCYRPCDELYLGLYVDQLQEDGTWQTVWSREKRGNDAYSLSYSINIFVEEGYYYRCRAGHIARFGTILESNISSTDGIYFGEGHDE